MQAFFVLKQAILSKWKRRVVDATSANPPVAHLDRALGFEPRGRPFESVRAGQEAYGECTQGTGKPQLSQRLRVASTTVCALSGLRGERRIRLACEPHETATFRQRTPYGNKDGRSRLMRLEKAEFIGT